MAESRFRAGDLVECIKGSGPYLVTGEIYLVDRAYLGAYNDTALCLKKAGVDSAALAGWFANRFRLYTPKEDNPRLYEETPEIAAIRAAYNKETT